jgi:hypothetical protein
MPLLELFKLSARADLTKTLQVLARGNRLKISLFKIQVGAFL